MKKQVYIVKQTEIKPAKLIVKANIFELIDEITPLSQNPLGFDLINVPDKE